MMSALSPAGEQAAAIAWLWWFFLWTTTAIFVAVSAAFAWGIWRAARAARHTTEPLTAPGEERSLNKAVIAAVAFTVAMLAAYLLASFSVGRAIAARQERAPVSVRVIGHQWWWEFEYEDPLPHRHLLTANELHVPVGTRVVLKMTSRDVIHSFWAPSLHGKRDLIPGIESAIWISADRPGRFRGQCAEYCGRQHAHMGFEVVAEPEADFHRWLEGQRTPAPAPVDANARRGLDVMIRGACVACHTVSGTSLQGKVAPDLSHLASRRTIGAALLPNTPSSLAAWIRNPQAVKPGSQMPPQALSDDDLQAVVAYLGTLQ
jgi:cytochrome c oxidase subunit II